MWLPLVSYLCEFNRTLISVYCFPLFVWEGRGIFAYIRFYKIRVFHIDFRFLWNVAIKFYGEFQNRIELSRVNVLIGINHHGDENGAMRKIFRSTSVFYYRGCCWFFVWISNENLIHYGVVGFFFLLLLDYWECVRLPICVYVFCWAIVWKMKICECCNLARAYRNDWNSHAYMHASQQACMCTYA